MIDISKRLCVFEASDVFSFYPSGAHLTHLLLPAYNSFINED